MTDKHPWLDKDDPQIFMMDTHIFHQKVNIEQVGTQPDQKKVFYKVLEKFKEAFRLCEEIGICH